MPLVNFTNLDFEQVKTSLIEYLRSNSNFTDYDFEGSNLSTIIDLLAYNTYITSYNANMVANEVFIDSATLRENVVSLARNIGYLPKSRKAATSSISFFVNTTNIQPAPASITLNRGTVATSQGSFAGVSGSFCILDDITVPVVNNIATFNNVPVYEGTFLTKNFTYNAQNPFQKFIVPNAGVDTELMRVSVKASESSTASTKYALQDSLFYVGSDSKVFYLQEVEDERYELIFGDGIFGKKLEEGKFADEVTVYRNLDDGTVRVEYNSVDNMSEAPVNLTFKPGMADETTKGKPADTFQADEIVPESRMVGPDDFEIEDAVDEFDNVIDLNSDVSKLKQFAGEKLTTKEIVEGINKRKRSRAIVQDRGEASDFMASRQGEYDYSPDDGMASGGIARMLGE